MSQEFVHLRLHSEFSIKDGMIKPKKVVHRAIAAGMKALALTDLAVMFGSVIFYKAALGVGLKPILGVDAWITNTFNRDDPHRLLFLCRNQTGYLGLCELLSRAWMENQHRGRGEIRMEWITPEIADGLIVLSGFQSGAIGKALLGGNLKEALAQAAALKDLFGENLYLELQRAGRADDERLVALTVNLAAETGLPVAATHPVQFDSPEDFEAHEVRVCIAEAYTLASQDRPKNTTPEQYFKSAGEMVELFADIPSAIENTREIAKRCNLVLNLGKPQLPVFPTPGGMSLDDYMAQLAREGLERRLTILYPDEVVREQKRPIYYERLEHEIAVIQKMEFPGYFLIVQDFINWAKTHGCPVGPGRGSGAGSLVAYSLGITDLDPLAYDLLFERFLNPERVSMPDFDVDFCQNNRGRVIEYVKEKYGADAVSQIATFGTMGAKAVIRDVARVLDMSFSEADKLAKLVPNNPGSPPDLTEVIDTVPEFRDAVRNDPAARRVLEFGLKLEGTTKSLGIHAGGVLIAPGKLTDFCPLYDADMLPENVISMYDKKDVESVGLVKFDFLGLTTLTIVERALDYIEANGAPRPDIEHVDIEDAEVYKHIFQKGDTVGVFQFESPGMHNLLIRARPVRLPDLIALNALYRPGPMDLIDDFIAIRDGQKEAEYADERLRPILEETSGIMVYQEQVMLVAQKIGGYSLGGADILRRAMGKKDVAEMERQSKVFLEGAAKNGVDSETATHLFELMRKFAGYGFNKSHAAAYSFVAYQTAWLKHYYPAEFLASSMCEVMTTAEKLVKLLQDALARGIRVLGPDINHSSFNFTSPDHKTIRFGLGAIKGLGPAPAAAIEKERIKGGPFKDIFDLTRRVGTSMISRKVLEIFALSGALDSLSGNRRQWFENAQLAIQLSAEDEMHAGQVSLFADEAQTQSEPQEMVRYEPWSRRTELEKEKAVLGFYLSGHPTQEYVQEMSGRYNAKTLKEAKEAANSTRRGETVQVAAMFAGHFIRNSRDGGRFVNILIEDGQSHEELSMDEKRFEPFAELIKETEPGEMLLLEVSPSRNKLTGDARLQLVSLKPLYALRAAQQAYLVLDIAPEANPEALLQTISNFGVYRAGSRVPVELRFKRSDSISRMKLPERFAMAPDWKFLNTVAELPGISAVTVQYR